MFDPFAFVAVAGIAAAGTGLAVTAAALAAVTMYRPGKGRRRRIRERP
jgi:hypothetical protein